MYIQRKQDLGVYYWLKDDLFSDVSSFVTIVDGFPTTNLVIPSIAVEAKELSRRAFELGNRTGLESRIWFIDIFAKNKSQRDEFGYRILNNIENGVPVYDYDVGFPPAVTPPKLGVLVPYKIEMSIKTVLPQLVENLYWRATISFTAIYNNQFS